MFVSVVVVTGVASPLSPLLEPSMAPLAAPLMYQLVPFPFQPSAKSIPSSPEFVTIRLFPFTVPPKNSIPSSPASYA